MAKGKYAARAANREAAHDNELLDDKIRQIESLTAKLGKLEEVLDRERRNRGSEIVRRADKLSAEQIRTIKAELSELARNYADEKRVIAEVFTDWFRSRNVFPDFWADAVLPILIPDTQERAAHILSGSGHENEDRDARRHAAQHYERALRTKAQRRLMTDGGRAGAAGRRGSNRVQDEIATINE